MDNAYLWKLQPKAPQEVVDRFAELSSVVVQLLHNRGMTTQEEVDRFLLPDYGQDQHDPYAFRDMKKTVERIKSAVEKNQNIIIHGDYDADGVCGTAVLYLTLKAIGANVDVYLPHRDTEGYGLNMNTVQSLHDIGTQLIITVDCGISNKDEVAKAVELGMDVIVTDHHSEPVEVPDAAYTIINPKVEGETYPFKELAGVGVSFKLCQALVQEFDLGEGFEKWLLDLVALSTITDFVPLVGENRVLVKYGLVVMQKNRRPGMRELLSVLDIDPSSIDTETIGFKIGPNINAAGRVKHANIAFELLVEEDDVKSREFAEQIRATNQKRQTLSDKMSKQAVEQAELQKDLPVIFVQSDDWPVGLIGLVAGKISAKYNHPTFVITTMGDEIMMSGRSIEHFDLIAALQSMDELFTKYGGHPMASGCTAKDEKALEEFKERMTASATEQLKGKDLTKILSIESELALPDVDWQLIEAIDQFAPFGESNAEPIFSSERVTVETFSAVGKTKDHLRLTVSKNGVQRKCIGFGLGSWVQKLTFGDIIDVAYAVSVNEWNGNREIQLELKDITL